MAEVLHGVIEGNTIRLTEPTAFPAGTAVRITLIQESPPVDATLAAGEGLKRAFGAWAEYADELEKFELETRELRKLERREQYE